MNISGVGKSGVSWKLSGYSGSGSKAGTWRLSGIDAMAKRINAELMALKTKSAAGMVVAASAILKDADETPPVTPVDLGNLRASTFVTPLKKPITQDPYVIFGYNSNYAAAVHEMMESPSGKPINWSRPGSGPKWFEAAIKRNAKRVIHLIKTTI